MSADLLSGFTHHRVPVAPSVVVHARCDPATIAAICEDYRAAAGIDGEHDREDDARGHLVRAPFLALWDAKGTVGALYEVPATWRDKAAQVEGGALPCFHLLQEEAPDALLDRLLPFLS